MAQPLFPPLRGKAVARTISSKTWWVFLLWTTFFWGGTGVLAALFFVGKLDFTTSSKIGLYGISIWLNGLLLPLILPGAAQRKKLDVWHEVITVWFICYTMTNALWEVPWLLSSPFIFDESVATLDALVAQTEWIRSNPLHMGYWMVGSFGSVDIRTINHNETFYTLELFAFLNIALAIGFWVLNARRSPLRYLIPLATGGVPFAATFIFSFSEVFNGYANMPGGLADTLLALVWTQYQYMLFPILCSFYAFPLFMSDLHQAWFGAKAQ